MELIDEEGNLLGVVNVIDALVVLLLLAVVVAGVALVTGGQDRTRDVDSAETGYATLELGQQPGYVIDNLESGDVGTLGETGQPVTVTDVYVTPLATAEDENATTTENGTNTDADSTDDAVEPIASDNAVEPHVTVRIEFETVQTGDDGPEEFRAGDETLLLGTEQRLDMGTYRTNGTVTDLSLEGQSLEIDETTTTVELEMHNVSPSVADALEEGMTETVRGTTHARIVDVEEEPAAVVLESDDGNIYERDHPRNVDVTLTVELRTQEAGTTERFRGEPVRIGSTVVLDFETLVVEGEVTAIA
ncbi:hypothetical protein CHINAEXTREME_14120 [Halobiforma lacisalsi AJ5]|uniref:DUF4330 domain-containing protein n=1 Tax=Natronobacterium lacisalsi AJ5 TaxID=358396 RepID=M0LFL9_NATLA|nr:DUF4330 family protein [Halobiforma lacisalsi]APW98849.1 hypothetical protein CHINAEXTREME_14120 [Halobiforma lacisalsi AJ5]EMA32346.1 hypothetical protein C445_11462 [Halobiforma lacisalsi AJ5]